MGLTTAACLASKGHKVYCVDNDLKKVNLVNKGLPAIYEPRLDEILKVVTKEKRLFATPDAISPVLDSSIIFICAGTPCREDGRIDLRQVVNAAKSIGKSLRKRDEYCTVVVKSTVVPKTTESILIPLSARARGRLAMPVLFISFLNPLLILLEYGLICLAFGRRALP